MKTFLCVVSAKYPENYHIGIQARTWGVERRYYDKISQTSVGDELVFMADQQIRSVHRIESAVYKEDQVLWPPKDGDVFPYRIKISEPLYSGEIPKDEFKDVISFMKTADAWGGTIMGPHGVFNPRLTDADVAFIKGRLKASSAASAKVTAAPEKQEVRNLFRLIGSDVLESLKRLLPTLGLRRFNGADFPAEYDLGYGGSVVLCRDVKNDDLVVVDFNRGEAPTDTLIRVLHYMSWVRQTLAGTKQVRGIILSESANEALSHIVREVPNVSLRFYRIGIELLGEACA